MSKTTKAPYYPKCSKCGEALKSMNKNEPIEPERPAVSGEVTGSGALTWSARKPKRRGWWWFRATPTAEAKIVEVYPNLDGELITKGGATFKWMKSLWPEMRWAGPLVEPVETPDAETTANHNSATPVA